MKQKTIFVCQECGAKSPRWVGQCPECGKWNTMAEELISSTPSTLNRRKLVNDGYDQPRPIS
ncbi:MAG: DNA repair protein RadA, partial [Candidatus Poribacteria bacterium]